METTRRWPYFHSLQNIINTLAEVRSLPSPQNVPPPVAVPPIREKCSSESTCMGQTLYKLKIASNFSHFFYIISKRLLTATLQICKNLINRYRTHFHSLFTTELKNKTRAVDPDPHSKQKKCKKKGSNCNFYLIGPAT